MVTGSVPEPGGPQIRGFPESFARRMKVLAIDGGGIRGLIPALVLAEIERRTGRRMAEMFDLIAGTSTGGILACALSRRGADGRPAWSARSRHAVPRGGPEDLHALADQAGSRRVGGLHRRAYDDTALNAALESYLGEARLKEALDRA